jgi:hypothetical protein
MIATSIWLLCFIGGSVLNAEGATTFNRSTVVGVDQAERTITFRTRDGQTWTLPVADPDILQRELVAKGDQVSIEIDLNDRITKVLKLSEEHRSEQPRLQDDLTP